MTRSNSQARNTLGASSASLPPARQRVSMPWRIIRAAVPIDCVAEAQAVEMQSVMPRAPNSIPTQDAGAFVMILGILIASNRAPGSSAKARTLRSFVSAPP